MASIDRVMAKVAASLLPGLLPTPRRSTIATCVIILPSSFASSKLKPGRADSVQRWDAHKKDKKPGSPSSSCGSSSPGRASSCERWDSNKKILSSSTSSSSQGSSISRQKLDYAKRPLSRASSTDRWDTHKKARSAQANAQSWTGEQEERVIDDKQSQEDTAPAPAKDPVFSGSSFFTSPESSMLPMPTFFRSRCPSMIPVPAH